MEAHKENTSKDNKTPPASSQRPPVDPTLTQSSPNSKNIVVKNKKQFLCPKQIAPFSEIEHEALTSHRYTATEANANEGSSNQDEDTALDLPPMPRPALARVVGNWAGSVRRVSTPDRRDVSRVSESMAEYLDAEAIEVVNKTPNGRRFILVGVALAFAVITIGSAVWFTQANSTSDQISCSIQYREDTAEKERITVGNCGDVGETKSRGKKYFFEGNGDFVTLSTCNAYTKGVETSNFYDSRIRVFETNPENNGEECVTGNNNDATCDHKASMVRFKSIPNVLYAVYIDGPLAEGGQFELIVSCGSAHILQPTLQPTADPTANPSALKPRVSSTKWRVLSVPDHLYDSGTWDIVDLQFYSQVDCSENIVGERSIINSNYHVCCPPEWAFNTDGVRNWWGGRPDSEGLFWLGKEYGSPKTVGCVALYDGNSHSAKEVRVQAWESSSKSWQNVMIGKNMLAGYNTTFISL